MTIKHKYFVKKKNCDSEIPIKIRHFMQMRYTYNILIPMSIFYCKWKYHKRLSCHRRYMNKIFNIVLAKLIYLVSLNTVFFL